MRPREDVLRARELSLERLSISQIAREVEVSRPTVRAWLSGDRERSPECERCGHPPHDFEALPPREYAYLLGVYLGDGTISAGRRRCYRLRIFMDSRYPRIIGEVVTAMRAVMPPSIAKIQAKPPHNLVEINSYSNAWPCLFPSTARGASTSARSSSRPGSRRSSTASPRHSSAACVTRTGAG